MLTRLQDNPEESLSESAERLTRAATALENNRAVVERWFWKCLLAFNCVLGSLAFWGILVKSF